jgi:hypothetical protein
MTAKELVASFAGVLKPGTAPVVEAKLDKALREAKAEGMREAAVIAKDWYYRFGEQRTDLGALAVSGAIEAAAKKVASGTEGTEEKP